MGWNLTAGRGFPGSESDKDKISGHCFNQINEIFFGDIARNIPGTNPADDPCLNQHQVGDDIIIESMMPPSLLLYECVITLFLQCAMCSFTLPQKSGRVSFLIPLPSLPDMDSASPI
jgi:hypothetical protein